MALIFFEGFDDTPNTNNVNYLASSSFSGEAQISYIENNNDNRVAGKFSSGASLYIRGASGSNFGITLKQPRTEVILCFDFMPTLAYEQNLFVPRSGNSDMLGISLYQYAGLRIHQGSNNLAIARNVLKVKDWNWLSIKYRADSVNGFIEVRNSYGDVLLSYSGNTLGSASNNNIDLIWFIGLATSYDWQFDNFFILDTSGPAPWNDHLTETRVFQLLPNAAGDLSEWTANGAPSIYEAVDEQIGNDDTDYVSSSTSGQRFLVNCQDLTRNETNYLGVVVKNRVKRDDAGLWKLEALIKSGGTVYNSPQRDIFNSDKYINFSEFWPVNPATGTAWDFNSINALQIGAKSTLA